MLRQHQLPGHQHCPMMGGVSRSRLRKLPTLAPPPAMNFGMLREAIQVQEDAVTAGVDSVLIRRLQVVVQFKQGGKGVGTIAALIPLDAPCQPARGSKQPLFRFYHVPHEVHELVLPHPGVSHHNQAHWLLRRVLHTLLRAVLNIRPLRLLRRRCRAHVVIHVVLFGTNVRKILHCVKERTCTTCLTMGILGQGRVTQVFLATTEAEGATTPAADPIAIILMFVHHVFATRACLPPILACHPHESHVLWCSQIVG